MKKIISIYFLFFIYVARVKEFWYEKIAKHLPKIRNPKMPKYPNNYPLCPFCGKEYHLFAFNTGDGWCFFWDCDNYHNGIEFPIVGWFPFIFGWASTKDLKKIGIGVV